MRRVRRGEVLIGVTSRRRGFRTSMGWPTFEMTCVPMAYHLPAGLRGRRRIVFKRSGVLRGNRQ